MTTQQQIAIEMTDVPEYEVDFAGLQPGERAEFSVFTCYRCERQVATQNQYPDILRGLPSGPSIPKTWKTIHFATASDLTQRPHYVCGHCFGVITDMEVNEEGEIVRSEE